MTGWLEARSLLDLSFLGTMIASRSAPYYVGYVVLLCAVPSLICYWKGERPQWRWVGTSSGMGKARETPCAGLNKSGGNNLLKLLPEAELGLGVPREFGMDGRDPPANRSKGCLRPGPQP